MEREFKVSSIKNGTVIDHITGGQALNVLKILKIKAGVENVVSAVMNVKSDKMRKKDIVKVENRELKAEEVDKIALIAPNATINIIREYEVVEKHKVYLPVSIEGTIKCANPNCISNAKEPVISKFITLSDNPPLFRCFYCERIVENVMRHL